MKKLLLILLTLSFIGIGYGQKFQKAGPVNATGAEYVDEYNNPLGSANGIPDNTLTDVQQIWALPSNGSTSINTRAPGNTFKYQRTEYLITAAEMAASLFPSGYTIDAIGFLIAVAGVGNSTGTFNVYLRNTSDVTYNLGTAWTTAGFTLVSSISSWSVPIVVGSYVVNFSGGSTFTYTGGGVYVAWEYTGTTVGTSALVANCNTALTNGLVGQRSSTAMPTTLEVSNFRPATTFVNNSILDIVNLTNIYTLEKTPIPYGAPTPITVRAANLSSSAATFNVILSVKNSSNTLTRYTSTQAVTALAGNTAALVNFTWTPTILEDVNITATTSAIAGETWTINNTVSQPGNVNNNLFSYNYSLAGQSGLGYEYPNDGIFASKFTMHGAGNVSGANLMISTDVSCTGNTIYAVLMNSTGTILSQSANYNILSGDLGTNKNFTFAIPVSFYNEDFYVGLAQTAGSQQWYPMATFDESPQRDNTFYTAPIAGGTLTVFDAGIKYGIEAQVVVSSATNPSSFVAAPVSSSQINLTWALNPSLNNVLIAWSPDGVFGTPVNGSIYNVGASIPGGGTVLQYNTSNSFNHTGLSAATTYYYKAWSYSGFTYSNGTGTNATSMCNATVAPITESFEATAFPPACWLLSNGSPAWIRSSAASGYSLGTASAIANFYDISSPSPFDLISLQFDASTMSNPVLKFDYAYATYTGGEVDQMDVYYSTDFGATWTLLLAMPGGSTGILNTGGTTTSPFVPTAGQWATQSLTIPNTANKVKFTAISDFGNNLYIDNISVQEAPAVNKTLNLKVYIEGLFAGAGTMNKAQGSSGDQFPGTTADQVTVELHDASPPFATAYTYSNVNLNTDGTIAISIDASITDSYYLVIKHRNSVETWSSIPLSFAAASPIGYDFTTNADKAFGNNLKQVESVFAIWGGETTQDGIVDGSDMAAIDNASTATMQGYNPEDVNGDGIVDGSDMAVIDNNSTATIQVIRP